ncbi:SRPBCC family protein [Pseudonocardia xinjiangensis]|uniref:SRPBCC family protein n=1 Tax=Pseudonocardia xinjiangensis TaxID=75289 RepID=UPI003D940419
MGNYEHSATVTTDPDALFDYLADIHHLPDYFAAMRSAEPAGDDAVHTVAEVDGNRREGEAWFTTDRDARTLRWGSEGPNDYSGELEVTGADGGAQVTVRLHTERVEGHDIDEGLQATLAQIKRNVEGGADRAAPRPS